jgi:hypothetical protein
MGLADPTCPIYRRTLFPAGERGLLKVELPGPCAQER